MIAAVKSEAGGGDQQTSQQQKTRPRVFPTVSSLNST